MRGFAQKCNSRKVPIQIKEEFTATHFLLVSPFLVHNHPLTLSPSFTLFTSPQIPYPILSRLSLERNNCSRTMHLLEALHVRQQHDANRNKNAAKRRRARRREKGRNSLSVFDKHLCASWYRSFSQKLSNRKTVRLPWLMRNIFFKTQWLYVTEDYSEYVVDFF